MRKGRRVQLWGEEKRGFIDKVETEDKGWEFDKFHRIDGEMVTIVKDRGSGGFKASVYPWGSSKKRASRAYETDEQS